MASPKTQLRPEEMIKEFQVILALEEKAARCYEQLASDCDDAVIKEWLNGVAKEEWAHVAIAKKLLDLVEKKIGFQHKDSTC